MPIDHRTDVLRAARAACSALALALAIVSCAGEAGDARALADAIAPHEDAIARFATWAERTLGTARPRDRAREGEALFSPVRAEPRFVTVIVERDGVTPTRWAHPSEAGAPELSWQLVRTHHLGTIEAARDPDEATHIWARVPSRGSGGLTLTLELAQ